MVNEQDVVDYMMEKFIHMQPDKPEKFASKALNTVIILRLMELDNYLSIGCAYEIIERIGKRIEQFSPHKKTEVIMSVYKVLNANGVDIRKGFSVDQNPN